jgi:hypothetical protein
MVKSMWAIAVAICLGILTGCQVIGPGAIEHGRINYNSVIQMTNKQQTFDNILYVYKYEMPEFMDVSEIDAIVLSSATFMGGESGIGQLPLGAASGTLQYQESPTIRYIPLYGQALVSQIASPISVNSLSDIINSGWPIAAVLDFALDRLAPSPKAHDYALDAIEKLWYNDAITIGTGIYQSPGAKSTPKVVNNKSTSKDTKQNAKSSTDNGSSASDTPADSLIIYLNPFALGNAEDMALWRTLLRIYAEAEEEVNKSTSQLPTQIILRNVPTRPVILSGETPRITAPLIRTRSALGILKAATHFDHFIEFVLPEQYAAIARCRLDHYYELNKEISDCGYDKRRYLMIIKSTTRPSPSDAYVIQFDEHSGIYYYIPADDVVSQESFTLLSLFIIIQAAPGPPQLAPTISVGTR